MEQRLLKPFEPDTLAESGARNLISLNGMHSGAEVFRIGGSLVHRRTGIVQSPKGEHRLRTKELELLRHLHAHMDVTFTRDELLEMVWRSEPGLMTRTVDQTVATLRKKIESDPDRPRFLQTVYGVGYRLVA